MASENDGPKQNKNETLQNEKTVKIQHQEEICKNGIILLILLFLYSIRSIHVIKNIKNIKIYT